tara:strand:- start:48 stop:497 length:450 start_codon:yes stop_codon:yes gene_type:complete
MSVSRNQSAERIAINTLLKNPKFKELTAKEKNTLFVAYARKNKVVHKRAFDLIRISAKIDFSSEASIMENIENITFIEVKSTKMSKDVNFSGQFFGLTMREMIMGQTYKNKYQFIFVDVTSENTLEMDLKKLYSRMKMDLVGHCTLDKK